MYHVDVDIRSGVLTFTGSSARRMEMHCALGGETGGHRFRSGCGTMTDMNLSVRKAVTEPGMLLCLCNPSILRDQGGRIP